MFEALNNSRRTVREGINTDNYEFVKLGTFTGRKILVDGFFFTQGKFGKQVVVVGNGCNINMPKRATEQFEHIFNNEEMLNAVLNGKLSITDIKEIDSKNGRTVAYTLSDN